MTSDEVAPVAYMRLNRLHLEKKDPVSSHLISAHTVSSFLCFSCERCIIASLCVFVLHMAVFLLTSPSLYLSLVSAETSPTSS